MTKISLEYNGQLRTKLVHNTSHTNILTDAPVDNHGLGESFSPTDLVAGSLAACMITVLGIKNNERELGIKRMNAEVDKHMADSPRKISQIDVLLSVQTSKKDDKTKAIIEGIARNCPVALSLNSALKQNIKIIFT